MTSASTMRTAAMQTKEALFSSKKKDIRAFPSLTTFGEAGLEGGEGQGIGQFLLPGCGSSVVQSVSVCVCVCCKCIKINLLF